MESRSLVPVAPPRMLPGGGGGAVPCSVCGLRGNSWLNLADGSVLCGRRQYDGSGGNGHALAHHRRTQRPLAVKLGTIKADLRKGGFLEARSRRPCRRN